MEIKTVSDSIRQYYKVVMTKIAIMAGNSPWIERLSKRRKIRTLDNSGTTDTVIIGAGIAGITTAYYLLKDTKRSVALLEAKTLANGATGHNAGQIVSYFEKSFSTLVREFGFALAADAQRAILSAWDLLDHISWDVDLRHKPVTFAGFAGCSSVDQLLAHFKNSQLRANAHIQMDFAYVKDDPELLRKIPATYSDLFSVVPHSDILSKLESKDTQYIAALTTRKGCMNSAKFCEEVVMHLLKKYPQRFMFYEQSPVSCVTLHRTHVMIDANVPLRARDVILCTNGFRTLRIKDTLTKTNKPLSLKTFVNGTVGHMSAFIEGNKHNPMAISYFPRGSNRVDPYFYVTRRKFTTGTKLVCTGGPERQLKKHELYDPSKTYVPSGNKVIASFLKKTYGLSARSVRFSHHWEGLMGYTATGVRCVGKHPSNPRLLYNLGCNGVGILPSIYGSKRISLLLQGKKLSPSIFDPVHAFNRTRKR